MTNLDLLKQNLLVSKDLVSSISETPKITSLEVEFSPKTQKLESLFSDSVHFVSTTRGRVPSINTEGNSAKNSSKLVSKVKWENALEMTNWLISLNVDSPVVILQSADIESNLIQWESSRTYLASQLENDMKYRVGIKELYMDRVRVRLKFNFNTSSKNYTRSRETLLRLNYLPLRLVKRLVK